MTSLRPLEGTKAEQEKAGALAHLPPINETLEPSRSVPTRVMVPPMASLTTQG